MTSPFVSEVSVEMTKRQETTWVVSYPKRADINLSQVLSCTLCLTAIIHEEAALGVLKNSTHLSPVYGQAADHLWLTNDSREFPAALLVPYKPLTHTTSQKSHLTSAVNITLLLPSAVSHFTSSFDPPERWTEWQMTAKWSSSRLCAFACFTAVISFR